MIRTSGVPPLRQSNVVAVLISVIPVEGGVVTLFSDDMIPASSTSITLVAALITALTTTVGALVFVVRWMFGHLDKVKELTSAIDRLTHEIKELRDERTERFESLVREIKGQPR